eukprot:6476642-Amphidinium_carterae.1
MKYNGTVTSGQIGNRQGPNSCVPTHLLATFAAGAPPAQKVPKVSPSNHPCLVWVDVVRVVASFQVCVPCCEVSHAGAQPGDDEEEIISPGGSNCALWPTFEPELHTC